MRRSAAGRGSAFEPPRRRSSTPQDHPPPTTSVTLSLPASAARHQTFSTAVECLKQFGLEVADDNSFGLKESLLAFQKSLRDRMHTDTSLGPHLLDMIKHDVIESDDFDSFEQWLSPLSEKDTRRTLQPSLLRALLTINERETNTEADRFQSELCQCLVRRIQDFPDGKLPIVRGLIRDMQWLYLAQPDALLNTVMHDTLPYVSVDSYKRALLLALPSMFEQKFHSQLAEDLSSTLLQSGDSSPLFVIEALTCMELPVDVQKNVIEAAVGSLVHPEGIEDVPSVLSFIISKAQPDGFNKIYESLRGQSFLETLWEPVDICLRKGKPLRDPQGIIKAVTEIAEQVHIASSKNECFAKSFLHMLLEEEVVAKTSVYGENCGKFWTLFDMTLLLLFARETRFHKDVVKLLEEHCTNEKGRNSPNSIEGEAARDEQPLTVESLLVKAVRLLSLKGICEAKDLPHELNGLFTCLVELASEFVRGNSPLGRVLYLELLYCCNDKSHFRSIVYRIDSHFSSSKSQEISTALEILTSAAENHPQMFSELKELLRSVLDHFDRFNEDNVREFYTMFAKLCYYSTRDDGMEDGSTTLTKNNALLMDSSGVNVGNLLVKQLSSGVLSVKRAGAIGSVVFIKRTSMIPEDSVEFFRRAARSLRASPSAQALFFDDLSRSLCPPVCSELLEVIDHELQIELEDHLLTVRDDAATWYDLNPSKSTSVFCIFSSISKRFPGHGRQLKVEALCPLLAALAKVSMIRTNGVDCMKALVEIPLELFDRSSDPSNAQENENRTIALFTACNVLRELLNVFHNEQSVFPMIEHRFHQLQELTQLYQTQFERAPSSYVVLPEKPSFDCTVLLLERRYSNRFSFATTPSSQPLQHCMKRRALHMDTVFHLVRSLLERPSFPHDRCEDLAFLLQEISDSSRIEDVARSSNPDNMKCIARVLDKGIDVFCKFGENLSQSQETERMTLKNCICKCLRLVQIFLEPISCDGQPFVLVRESICRALLPYVCVHVDMSEARRQPINTAFDSYNQLLSKISSELDIAAGVIAILKILSKWLPRSSSTDSSLWGACCTVLDCPVSNNDRWRDRYLQFILETCIHASEDPMKEIARFSGFLHEFSERKDVARCHSLSSDTLNIFHQTLMELVVKELPTKVRQIDSDREKCLYCFEAFNHLLLSTKSKDCGFTKRTLKVVLKNGSIILRRAASITCKCLVPGYKNPQHRSAVQAGVTLFQKGYRQLLAICNHVQDMKGMYGYPSKARIAVNYFVHTVRGCLPPDLVELAVLKNRDLNGKYQERREILSQSIPRKRREESTPEESSCSPILSHSTSDENEEEEEADAHPEEEEHEDDDDDEDDIVVPFNKHDDEI